MKINLLTKKFGSVFIPNIFPLLTSGTVLICAKKVASLSSKIATPYSDIVFTISFTMGIVSALQFISIFFERFVVGPEDLSELSKKNIYEIKNI